MSEVPSDGAESPADRPPDSLAGRLLVATPGVLEDPNFRRTVVLMLEHGEQGALGVVLNRPSETPVLEPFPDWDGYTTSPPVLFVGGPVSQQMIIALGKPRDGETPDGWIEVLTDDAGGLGTVDLRREPWLLATQLDQLRVFAGYAGWSSGQLEAEIEAGAWFVADAEPWDAFANDPDGLWRRVLRRQRGTTAYYANYPADPRWN
jgi:putative transcriptional regulator